MKPLKPPLAGLHFIAFLLLLLPQSPRAQGADAMYAFASHLKRDGLYEAAGEQFLKFAIEYAEDRRAPRALESAVECFVEIKSLDSAIKVLETLLETYPEDVNSCQNKVQLGKLFYKVSRFEEAEQILADVVVAEPLCPLVGEALLGRGESLLALSRVGEARDLFAAVAGREVGGKLAPRALYDLALAENRLGRLGEALGAFDRLARTFPRHPLSGFAALESARLHLASGDTLSALGSFEGARRFQERAIFVPACLEGAKVLEALGRFQEALSWYGELVRLKDLEAAGEVFEGAVRAAYLSGEFSKVYELSGMYDERFKGTFSPELVFYKARAALELGDYELALRTGGELEIRDAGGVRSGEAALIIGEALLGMGRPREAIGQMRRFVSSSPDDSLRVIVLEKLSTIYMTTLRDTASALEALLEKMEAAGERGPDELYRVASLYEKAGDLARARKFYSEIASSFPLSREGSRAEKKLRYLSEYCVVDPRTVLEEMDRVSLEIASLGREESLLRLAEARMKVEKDIRGAARLLDKLLSSYQDGEASSRAIYLRGSCHAREAERCLLLGDSSRAREELSLAARSWSKLKGESRKNPWPGRAACEEILLRARVEGEFDTLSALNVVKRYPSQGKLGGVLELLGDFYGTLPGGGGVERQIDCYRKALSFPGGLEDKSVVELKLAESLFHRGDYGESLSLSRGVFEEGEGGLRLRAAYWAGASLRQLGRYGEAIPFFIEVSKRDPTGALGSKSLLQAADCRYLSGDFAGALEDYQAARRCSPGEGFRWKVTYRLALCEEKLGDPARALKWLLECLASRYGGELRKRAYGRALALARELGEVGSEGDILTSLVEEFEGGEEVRSAKRDLARWYLKTGKPKRALALARELLSSGSGGEKEVVRALLAMSLYRSGSLGEAGKLHEELKRTAPSDSLLLLEVSLEEARAYSRDEDYQKAAAVLGPLLRSCPGGDLCDEALFLYIISLFDQGKIKEASVQAQILFKEHPFSKRAAAVHIKLGKILSRRRRFAEAVVHYREAASQGRDSSLVCSALKALAVTYQDLSMWREAEDVWEELLLKYPSFYAKEASLNIGRCRMEAGDFELAIDAYDRASPFLDGEGKARASYWKGECYQKLGDHKSAVLEYLKVPYLFPEETLWAVTAQIRAAECYASLGRSGAARVLYEKIVRKYGENSQWGKVARGGLEKLGGEGEREPGGDK